MAPELRQLRAREPLRATHPPVDGHPAAVELGGAPPADHCPRPRGGSRGPSLDGGGYCGGRGWHGVPQCYGGKAYRLTRTAPGLSTFPYLITKFGFLTQSVLPGAQALERFPLVFTRRSGEGSQLVLWDGLKGRAQRLFQVAAPDAFETATANQRWALVDGYPKVHLVALDGSGTLDLPWEDEFGRRFLDMFTLVAPERLYNALDDTFYTVVGQALKPTKFRPDPLAAALANAPSWPFHLVRPR